MDLRFVGILLAAAAAGGPAALAGGAHQGTGPPPPVPPTIMFDQPSSVTVGTPVSLSASVSPAGGLPLLFQSATRSVCTVPVNQPTVTTLTAGTCTITAFQDGKPPQAATAVTRSFQVQAPAGPIPQTITFGPPPNATVGTPVTLSAHASSGLAVQFSSDTPSACAVTQSPGTHPGPPAPARSPPHRAAAPAPQQPPP